MNSTTLTLTVNGKTFPYTGQSNADAFLKAYNAPAERVALVVNDDVIARTQWAETSLREGDRIEILVMAGGG